MPVRRIKRKATAAELGTRKAARTSSRSSPRSGVKFSNPDTVSPQPSIPARTVTDTSSSKLSELPSYLVLRWPKDEPEDSDESESDSETHKSNRDVPKSIPTGQPLGEEWTHRVSDYGYPISRDGVKILDKLHHEQEKRDQDLHGMFIYTDWNGWGYNELLTNMLKTFNRDLYKKTVSPYKKWAYVEGFTAFLQGGRIWEWMMNDDSDTIKAIMNMFGIMLFTSFEMLAEHDLFKPDSSIKNISIIPLLWLEFIDQDGGDLDITWGCEVVRLCDEAGIDLTESLRSQVKLDKTKIEAWREEYRKKKECQDGDGYKYWAEKKDWTPKDDWKVQVFDWGNWDVRKWYRWDWKLEFKEFSKNHSTSGNYYDITTMPKAERESHTLGTAAFDRKIEAKLHPQ
ncbi:SAP domain-containing isoform 2 protein [Rutstroemia sp. NJR-2017a WRK4]|nr:SAP domain-containing isoform 2 protein [Rutstroemia sp. NJR-2017a WRK4]